jgi:K(+)-stimulated pyrophosphate-energized sodium pump
VGPDVLAAARGTILAAEGGYQSFTLGGGEKLALLFSALTALAALGVGFSLMKDVLAADKGTPAMVEIADAIQEGASAYLSRQFRTIAVIVVPLAVVVFLTSTSVLRPDGTEALSFFESGLFRTLAFIAGCLLSGLTGFIGMGLAVRGNVRTAAAAKTGSLPAALKVAFRTGGVAGMFTVGLGLLGATIVIALFQNTSSAILIGFGFGGSLLALFLRVGGGIFTKAADVGADLVGKVEAGSPRTTSATPPPSPTTSGTTSATARAWRRTCSRATRSPSSPRSSSASPPSSRSAPTRPTGSCSPSSPGPSACSPPSWGCTR